MHAKEVTQTKIHKGQHEWDRISAYSSFTWQGSFQKKKEKTANASTPGQVLNQLCRKAAAWIANQNPYTRPPSPLSAQDTVHPTTTNTQNSS